MLGEVGGYLMLVTANPTMATVRFYLSNNIFLIHTMAENWKFVT
jgi:hypothetical protein